MQVFLCWGAYHWHPLLAWQDDPLYSVLIPYEFSPGPKGRTRELRYMAASTLAHTGHDIDALSILKHWTRVVVVAEDIYLARLDPLGLEYIFSTEAAPARREG